MPELTDPAARKALEALREAEERHAKMIWRADAISAALYAAYIIAGFLFFAYLVSPR